MTIDKEKIYNLFCTVTAEKMSMNIELPLHSEKCPQKLKKITVMMWGYRDIFI
jgi:hypothetical protein